MALAHQGCPVLVEGTHVGKQSPTEDSEEKSNARSSKKKNKSVIFTQNQPGSYE